MVELNEEEIPNGGKSFKEIGEILGISEREAKRTFTMAMKKLKSPKLARDLWDWDNISLEPADGSNSCDERF